MHVGAEPDQASYSLHAARSPFMVRSSWRTKPQPLFSTDLPGQHLPALRSLLDTVNNEVHSAEVLKLGHEETYTKVPDTTTKQAFEVLRLILLRIRFRRLLLIDSRITRSCNEKLTPLTFATNSARQSTFSFWHASERDS